MIPVDQTILHDAERGIRGNCQQAAVASILDLPLEAVPNFHHCEQGFWQGVKDFIRSRGYAMLVLRSDHYNWWLSDSGVYYLAYGQSPRGVQHAVIYRHGKLAHDPHPSRAGIASVEEATILVPL